MRTISIISIVMAVLLA